MPAIDSSQRPGYLPSIAVGAALGGVALAVLGNGAIGIGAGIGIGAISGALAHAANTENGFAMLTTPLAGTIGGAIAGAALIGLSARFGGGSGAGGIFFGGIAGGVIGAVTGMSSLLIDTFA